MKGQGGRQRFGSLSSQKSPLKLGAGMSSKRGERRMQDFRLGSEFKKGSKRGGELVGIWFAGWVQASSFYLSTPITDLSIHKYPHPFL